MTIIPLIEINKKAGIKPEKFVVVRNDAKKIKQEILKNYVLKGNVLLLDFSGIESITGSFIDESVLKEYEQNQQKNSSDFLGAFAIANPNRDVYESIENELLARMKKKEKTNEFILYKKNSNPSWQIIPERHPKPFLETKLMEALTFLMSKKSLTSTELASLLKHKENITTKNARIRLEKLFNFRLVKKSKGEGKEFVYNSLF